MEFTEHIEVPDGFVEARAIIRDALMNCERAKVSNEAVIAVLLSEVMPRLVDAHGPRGVATVLRHLGDHLASGAVEQLRQ